MDGDDLPLRTAAAPAGHPLVHASVVVKIGAAVGPPRGGLGISHMPYLHDLRTRARAVALAAVVAAFAPAAASAEEHHHGSDSDWLFFLTGQERVRSDEDLAPQKDFDYVSADVLYSHSTGPFRMLAETFVSRSEVEVERAQFGWEFGENTLVWAGRFHQPSSAWNTQHHHGQYLQTAITRPNIEHWEDEGGLVPQHIAGVLLETRAAFGPTAGLTFSLGGGAAPVITDGAMSPIGVFKSNVGGHRASWSARASLLPEQLGEDAIGIVAARHDVNVRDAAVAALLGADDIGLDVLGGFVTLDRRDWRLQATWYDIDVALNSGARTRHEHFGAGYLQAERALPGSFRLYGRAESSDKAGDSVYVTFQRREFELRRKLVGVRWDLARNQALSLEAARATSLAGDFNEIRVQWSGVVP